MGLFYILIFLMPLENHPLWSKTVGGLTLFKYLGLACFLFAVFHFFERRGPPAFLRTWQSRFFAIFVVIASCSYLTESVRVFGTILPYVSFLLLFFITLTEVDSLDRLHLVLLVYVGSAAFASLYVIREWQHDGFGESRPGWIVGDPNSFGVIASLCLPVAFCLMLEKRLRWERLFYAGSLFLTLVALIAGASRGGFLGLLAAFIFVALKSRRAVRTVLLASLVILPTSLLLPSSPVRRFLHPHWGDSASIAAHETAWNGGMHMVASHPFFGVGLGNFKRLVVQYEDSDITVQSISHNTYLGIAAELGIPALVIFLALFLFSYRCLDKVRRQALQARIRFLEVAALGIQGGLVGYSVSAFFVDASHEKGFWLLIFVSMCLPVIGKRAARNPKTADELVNSTQIVEEVVHAASKRPYRRIISPHNKAGLCGYLRNGQKAKQKC